MSSHQGYLWCSKQPWWPVANAAAALGKLVHIHVVEPIPGELTIERRREEGDTAVVAIRNQITGGLIIVRECSASTDWHATIDEAGDLTRLSNTDLDELLRHYAKNLHRRKGESAGGEHGVSDLEDDSGDTWN